MLIGRVVVVTRTYSNKSSLVTLTVWLELNVLIGRVVVVMRTYSCESSFVTLTVWLELNVLIGRGVVVTRTYSCKSSLVTLTVWFGTECVDRSCGSSNEDLLQQVITRNIDSLVWN